MSEETIQHHICDNIIVNENLNYGAKGLRSIFGKYSGTEVKVNGQDVLVMREEDIMGVVE